MVNNYSQKEEKELYCILIISQVSSSFLFFLFLGTQVDPRGGFNEQFGRNPELDRLARLFIANVFYQLLFLLQNNEKQLKRIIKETAKLRHRYRSTAKYYRVMKNVSFSLY